MRDTELPRKRPILKTTELWQTKNIKSTSNSKTASSEASPSRAAATAIISHSTSEFVLDFAAVLPGVPKAKVKSRIILAPEHAKRLLLSLQENIARYEANVGRINIPQSGSKEGIKGFNMGEA